MAITLSADVWVRNFLDGCWQGGFHCPSGEAKFYLLLQDECESLAVVHFKMFLT